MSCCRIAGLSHPGRTNLIHPSLRSSCPHWPEGFTEGLRNSNSATIAQGPLERLYRQNSFDLWVGDTYRINSRPTLNYGARFTYQGVLHDSKNSITNFIPGQGFGTPGVNGAGALYPEDWNNVAPRFGFAKGLSGNK
jgi:hypothetical protein